MTYDLLVVLAVLGAVLGAYVGNRLLFRWFGQRAAIAAVPWWEEACKLVAIVAVPGALAPVLPVHLLFGMAEFGYDWWRNRQDGFFLGLVTFVGHGLFGGLAALIAVRQGSLWGAYVVAGLAHSLYNLAVMTLILPTLGAGAYAGAEKR
jgi:hypothetical protein